MHKIIRIILTFLAVTASYFFLYWIPLSLIAGTHKGGLIPFGISLIIAILIGIFFWKKTANITNNLLTCIFLGGIILGTIGFILGFFGPMLIYPSSNQGPLLGLFITAPIGFIIGLLGGGLYWFIEVKNK